MSARPHWRLGLVLAGVAAYALLSHALMLHAADRPWAVLVLLGPLLATGLGLALRRRHPAGIAAALGLTALLVLVAARGGLGEVNRLYVAQHAGIHLLLFGTFAGSLRQARGSASGLSLIGELALRVHPLTPAMVVYTRHVTQAWAAYFLAMALASVWVYATQPWEAWSLLANVGTPLAIAAIFVGEYLLRYRLHPEFERSSFIDAVRAYNREGRRS